VTGDQFVQLLYKKGGLPSGRLARRVFSSTVRDQQFQLSVEAVDGAPDPNLVDLGPASDAISQPRWIFSPGSANTRTLTSGSLRRLSVTYNKLNFGIL
jgi:hypothetical protein